jgi:hypothetical protein
MKTGSRLKGPPEENLTFWSDPAVLSSPPYFAPHTYYMHIKGTVSRDFRLLVFFMNQFLPSP